MNDWDRDGKKGTRDSIIDYNIYKDITSDSSSNTHDGTPLLAIIITVLVIVFIGWGIVGSGYKDTNSNEVSGTEDTRVSETRRPTHHISTTNPAYNSNSHSTYHNNNSYSTHNSNDYYDAEDFYEDNYDDFDDYEDAEEYYDEWGE